jgi:hypothetical protein
VGETTSVIGHMSNDMIEPGLRKLFCHEIESQCTNALSAADDMKICLDMLISNNEGHRLECGTNGLLTREQYTGKFGSSVQNFLTSSANPSKILWSKDPTRGDELRTLLGVPDDSPIKDKLIRNGLLLNYISNFQMTRHGVGNCRVASMEILHREQGRYIVLIWLLHESAHTTDRADGDTLSGRSMDHHRPDQQENNAVY